MRSKLLTLVVFFFSLKLAAQSFTYNEYREFVLSNYNFEKHYDTKRNIYSKNNVVHIFVDENGNLIETGIPTTAIENYSYRLHLITNTKTINDGVTFEYSVKGEYKPTFNVQNEILKAQETLDPRNEIKSSEQPEIIEFPYAIVGPFTTDFEITLKRKKNDKDTTILNTRINVAKTYHVTVSTGLFVSTLKNPTNIKAAINSNGEPTLMADDQATRGVVSLNAVFYPKGRTFLFPPSKGNRLGFLVGTQLNKNQFENFLGGIQFDFARGGGVAFGAHYGRINTIRGNKSFDFGNEKFDGDVNTAIVKEWDVGFFVGVNLDLRIFGQLFTTSR